MNAKQRMEWAIFLLLMQAWFFVLWTHGADWAWGVLGLSGAVSLIALIALELDTIVPEPAVDPMHFELDRPKPPRWDATLDATLDRMAAFLDTTADRLYPAGKKPRMQQIDGIKYRPRLQPEPLFVCPQNSFLHPHDQHGRHLYGYEEEMARAMERAKLPDLDAERWLRKELERQGIEVRQDNGNSYVAHLMPDVQFPCNDISIFTHIEPGSLFVCPENSLPHPHDRNGRHM